MEQSYYDSLIKMEFPNYYFNPEYIKESADEIREYLPELKHYIYVKLDSVEHLFKYEDFHYTDSSVYDKVPEFYVNAYVQKIIDDSALIKITNYFPRKIHILGTGVLPDYMSSIDVDQNQLPAYLKGAEGMSILMKADSSSRYLYFMLEDSFDTYVTPINQWPYPEGLSASQELELTADLNNFSFITKKGKNELVFSAGDYRVSEPIIIPKGYKITIEAGTKIDLVDGAMFISYSPVYLLGKEENPIIITSSDFTANAFTVLQAKERSVLNHVVFENLNTLNYKGWTHTGAVTFYESDVDIKNAKFYRNQCEDALNIIRSDFRLAHSVFDFTFGDAFDSDFSTGEVFKTEFTNIGNDAIDFSGSVITINEVTITETGDKGISGGEESYLIVRNVRIQNSNIGIASKDLSVVEVTDSEVADCNYGLVLLQKKPEYGPGFMAIENTIISKPKQELLIEKGSELRWDGKLIKGNKENVADLFY